MKPSTPIPKTGRERHGKTWLVPVAVLPVVAFVFLVRAQVVSGFQNDACRQISYLIAERIGEGEPVTPEMMTATARRLIEASVINGRIDPDGNPVDWNGNAYRIEVGAGSVTTSTRRTAFHPFRASVTVEIGKGGDREEDRP